MATAILSFQKQSFPSGDLWAAKFVSQGTCVIEIERDTPSPISVYANLDGMAEVPVTNFQNGYTANAIFELDIAEGVEVTIKSSSEVKSAKMLS